MAIVVIKENPVPRQEVTCENCGSILEYCNADYGRWIEKKFDKLRDTVFGTESRYKLVSTNM